VPAGWFRSHKNAYKRSQKNIWSRFVDRVRSWIKSSMLRSVEEEAFTQAVAGWDANSILLSHTHRPSLCLPLAFHIYGQVSTCREQDEFPLAGSRASCHSQGAGRVSTRREQGEFPLAGSRASCHSPLRLPRSAWHWPRTYGQVGTCREQGELPLALTTAALCLALAAALCLA